MPSLQNSSFAILAAIRRASSRVSSLAASSGGRTSQLHYENFT
jgi:hypothetical protein